MAVFKCKMCGGTLEINNNETVAVCEYCGTRQTLPKSNDEVVSNLFNRANNLRLKCEFDKAEQVYEKILEVDNTEAEAHWGIVLCKYGIEYVEDPKTYTRIPTCHRTSYDSIFADSAYLSAVTNADGYRKVIYEDEARKINDIQREILNVVKNEKPFDVFICYKETDESGQRTVDSAIANDIYHHLTDEGFKVFYSAITLEDKLGEAYEPYIFSALNSAKVMLVIGTKPEYFEAIWVKNEWSRFLKVIKADRSKLLIPCYRNMDVYDLPEEFSHLQAQDMSKIGFINDIVRGIKKVLSKDIEKAESVVVAQATSTTTNVAPLLKRAFMFLEDGDFESADEYCEKVLDIDPECAMAYIGKLLVYYKVDKIENLSKIQAEYFHNKIYEKAIRFANDKLKNKLEECLSAWKEKYYKLAVSFMENAKTAEAYRIAAEKFRKLGNYKNSESLCEKCLNNVENIENLIKKQSNLHSKIKAKKNSLDELNQRKIKLETRYISEKDRLKEIQINKKRSSTITFILAIINSILLLVFLSLVINSSEEMTDFHVLAILLSMLVSIVSYIAFVIKWIFSKETLSKGFKEVSLRGITTFLFPPISYIIAIINWSKIRKSNIDTTSLQEYLSNLAQLQNNIDAIDSEIKQLINQVNQLSIETGILEDVSINDSQEIRDEMLLEAINVVVDIQSASTTLLQRKLKIGYARAARMIDTLEEMGVVGPYAGAAPRQVLISKEQWEQMKHHYR